MLYLLVPVESGDEEPAEDELPQACQHVDNVGSYTRAPEFCDNDAEPGSEFCAWHQTSDDDYDNSDEPYDC